MRSPFTALRTLGALAALSALVLVTACGQEMNTNRAAPGSASESDANRPNRPQQYAVTAVVLANASHGPQICHVARMMMPPTCSGPDVVGWDWDAVTSQSVRGIRWGTYHLTGIWDGKRLTLTEPAKNLRPGDKPRGGADDRDFRTPCKAPPGGWKPVDRSKVSHAAEQRLQELLEQDPEYGGHWISYPAGLRGGQTVTVVTFTGDLPGNERQIRTTWGGPLCLLTVERSQQELLTVREDLVKRMSAGTPGYLGVGSDPVNNRVRLYVTVPSDHMQRELDRRYGKGAVGLSPWLHPKALPGTASGR
ncbi:hypothetical protein [Streptomyces sp. AM8-1-1]|uniref:hypothetical protein n=1 Tax=Streptomyces sp. AM8-1-1 TaxID=3075825 RepID=UPI0028C3AAFC|nr:hypothetical protein [Streptomyces sp. AM8-1-1]WNO72313.1 hypothetical protein RPQ07_12035 [Streptomyces sp. AM8-1-1]